MNTYTCPKCDCVYYTCRICSFGKCFPPIMIKRQLRKHHNDNHLKMDKIPMVENSGILGNKTAISNTHTYSKKRKFNWISEIIGWNFFGNIFVICKFSRDERSMRHNFCTTLYSPWRHIAPIIISRIQQWTYTIST